MSIKALFIKHNVGDTFTVLDENNNEFKVITKPDKDLYGCTRCVLSGVLCPRLQCVDGQGHHYELLQASEDKD